MHSHGCSAVLCASINTLALYKGRAVEIQVSYTMDKAMKIVDLVLEQYRGLDRLIDRFRNSTGLKCLAGCSYCCRNWPVEATVLEVLPLAKEIYARRKETSVMGLIEDKQSNGDETCVMVLPESKQKVAGYCAYYEWRPLMCRLFGFAARRDKYGKLELCTCRIITQRYPAEVGRSRIALREGLPLPIYQDTFFQIASIDPYRGYRRLPINLAIKEALEYIYWIRPRGNQWKMASGC